MYSGVGYRLGNYDSRTGKEPSSIVGKQSVGNTSLKYLYSEEEDVDEDLEENEQGVSSISSKIVHSMPMTATDPYAARSVDRAAGQLKNTGGANVFEYAGNHKNYIRNGISPYPQPQHTGGIIGTGASDQAFKTTGNFKRTGTQYGSSRPHKNLTDIDDSQIFNLSDLIDEKDPDIYPFARQQNRVKKVLMSIDE